MKSIIIQRMKRMRKIKKGITEKIKKPKKVVDLFKVTEAPKKKV